MMEPAAMTNNPEEIDAPIQFLLISGGLLASDLGVHRGEVPSRLRSYLKVIRANCRGANFMKWVPVLLAVLFLVAHVHWRKSRSLPLYSPAAMVWGTLEVS